MDEIREIKCKLRSIQELLHEVQMKIVNNCNHQYLQEIPDGPRDNGEFYYRCRLCGHQK